MYIPVASSNAVAGVWESAAASRVRSQLVSLLNAARAHRGHVWVAGYFTTGTAFTRLASEPLRLPLLARCPALGASPRMHGDV